MEVVDHRDWEVSIDPAWRKSREEGSIFQDS
jgi:hypothetical protein